MASSSRVALITGCGKRGGIGASAARALAAAGITVVVSDVASSGVANHHNTAADLDQSWGGVDSLVDELVKAGGAASSILGDVTAETDAKRMVDDVVGRYGRIDILINNAGAPHGDDRNEIEDIPLKSWELVMAVNVRGPFLMSRAAVPYMRKAKWGRIIMVSSVAALHPLPRRAAYTSSKAASFGLTKALAVDLAAYGITVNAVLPGPIMTSRALSSARRDSGDVQTGLTDKAKRPRMGRMGHPDEVGATIAFLASDASSYITGQGISVDGGISG